MDALNDRRHRCDLRVHTIILNHPCAMNKRVENTINELAELCVDSLTNFDDYTIDGDEQGLTYASVGTHFDYKGCFVECSYVCTIGTRREDSIEILLNPQNENHMLTSLEEAVNEQVKEKLDTDDLLDYIQEQARSDVYDEWNEHGFRDAADYYSWRYG